MISLERLQHQLSKFNEKQLTLPKDNQYTQLTSLQIKKKEIESTNVCQTEESDYTMTSIVDNILSSQNDTVEHIDESIEETSIPNESLLLYNENDVIDSLPEILHKIFKDVSNLYLYGFKNPESFYKSIVLQTVSDYILKSKSEKYTQAITFKREMAINLNEYYSKNLYRKLKFNKNGMTQTLLTDNLIDYPTKIYMSDYIKYNIYILDIVNKTYANYNKKYDNNLVLIFYDNTYLPVMNSNGHNYFNTKFISNIEENFNLMMDNEHYNLVENISCESDENVNYNNLSLTDLQKLATEKQINILKPGKSGKDIKKTKKELSTELNYL